MLGLLQAIASSPEMVGAPEQASDLCLLPIALIGGILEALALSTPQSALMPANLITLPHFSVSSASSVPKSAGEPGSTAPPTSANNPFILGSARAALISALSLATISAGVFLGAAMPYQPLAS